MQRLDDHRRHAGQCSGLRVGIPVREAACRGRDTAALGHRLFDIGRPPAAQRVGHRIAAGGIACGQAERAQRAVAVVGEVGMQPHMAGLADGVTTGVEAGELVPQRRADAIDQGMRAAFGHGMVARDLHLLPRRPGAQVPQLGRSQPGRPQAGLGRRGHLERRGQHRFLPGQSRLRQRRFRQAFGPPERGQDGFGGRWAGHGACR